MAQAPLDDCAEVKAPLLYTSMDIEECQKKWDALKECPYLIQAFFSISKFPPF